MNWRVFAASAIGKHHIDVGLPCQDAFSFERMGNHLIGAVCDGAGSAAHSELGAAAVARGMVSGLSALVSSPDASATVPAESIATIAARSRQELMEMADQQQIALRDLACTLVGFIIAPEGGWFFHVGDGLALAEYEDGKAIFSPPENGEYANETYFLTADDWADHLRLTPLPAGAATIVAMSDGAMPFVMNRTRDGLFSPFIVPVKKYLATVSEEEGSAGLAGTLGDERTWAITGDDKTLLLAFAAASLTKHEDEPISV